MQRTRWVIFSIVLWLFSGIPLIAESKNLVHPGIELQRPKRLLFLDFYNETGLENYSWLEPSIGESMHELVKKKYRYEKIPTEVWKSYFNSHGLEKKDLFDLGKVSKIAHDLGADGVIYGKFSINERHQMHIEGKILSAIDQEIIAEKSAECNTDGKMFTAVGEVSDSLAAKINDLFFPSDSGAATRAVVLPGWGHRYKARRTWGYIWGGAFWVAAGFTAFSLVRLISLKVQYANYSPDHYTSPTGEIGLADPTAAQAKFSQYEHDINQWSQLSLIGFGATAGIYLANILHAYIIAPDFVGDQSKPDRPAMSFFIDSKRMTGLGSVSQNFLGFEAGVRYAF